MVEGLEDVSKYPDLTAELLKRGYKDDDVKKILGLNVLRVMRQAEKVAAGLQKTRQPSTATIEQLDQDTDSSEQNVSVRASGSLFCLATRSTDRPSSRAAPESGTR